MPRKRSVRPADHEYVTIGTRISGRLNRALEEYLATLDPPNCVSAVLGSSLRKLLKSKGFWPPPPEDSETS